MQPLFPPPSLSPWLNENGSAIPFFSPAAFFHLNGRTLVGRHPSFPSKVVFPQNELPARFSVCRDLSSPRDDIFRFADHSSPPPLTVPIAVIEAVRVNVSYPASLLSCKGVFGVRGILDFDFFFQALAFNLPAPVIFPDPPLLIP